jgi:putative mRNA 3-end processing factor
MKRVPLLRMTAAGTYCELGGFHIDPCQPVARAVITHAHADHITRGCRSYLTATQGVQLLRSRLNHNAVIQPLDYGAGLDIAGVRVSLHPAGHILGSAQVRMEYGGEVWVFTGDYKTTPDSTCTPFEPVTCHTLITESTFGNPVFRWSESAAVMASVHNWWRANQERGVASLLYAYALGKAQRLWHALDPNIGPIAVHRDVTDNSRFYEQHGVTFPTTFDPHRADSARHWSRGLYIVPPSSRWRQPFPFHAHYATAFVSGWMLLPGGAEKRRVDTGFALSDHADHAEILATVAASGAERVGVMHGYIDPLVAELNAAGLNAFSFRSPRCGTPMKTTAQQLQLDF